MSSPPLSCLSTWIIFNLDQFSNAFLQPVCPDKLLAQWSELKQQQMGESEFLQVVSYEHTVQISAQVQKQSEIIMKILLKFYIHIYCLRYIGLLSSNLCHNLNFEIQSWKPVEEIINNFSFKIVYLNT